MGRSPSRPGATSQQGSERQAACSICKGRAHRYDREPFRQIPSQLLGPEPLGRNHTRGVQTARIGQDASRSGEIPHPRGEKAQIFFWERTANKGCADESQASCRDPDPVSPQGLQSRFDAISAPSLHVMHEGCAKLAVSASTCKDPEGLLEDPAGPGEEPISSPTKSVGHKSGPEVPGSLPGHAE